MNIIVVYNNVGTTNHKHTISGGDEANSISTVADTLETYSLGKAIHFTYHHNIMLLAVKSSI